MNQTWRRIASWMVVLFLAALPTHAGDVKSRRVTCEGKKYHYLLSVPEGPEPLPALLLLHGSGDSPEPMVEAWKGMAKTGKFVLIAPELPLRRDFEEVAPRVFECVVDDAKHYAPIDAKRIYVFGNSMGGYLAYDAAAFDSEYFAAVAVHAMGIDPGYDNILDHARRKTPVAIYMGDRDPLVSLKNVRRTRDLLEQRGFPVRYVELKDHDHNYYRVAERINPDIWNFLREKELR